MSRKLLLIAGILLAASLLFANGQSDQGSSESDKIKITWNGYNIVPVEEDGYVLRYLEDRFNVDIEYVYIENNKAEELLNLMFATEDEPDVWQLKGNPYASLGKYYEEDLIAEISEDMMRKFAPNTSRVYDEYDAWGATKIEGKIVNFPEVRFHNVIPAPIVWNKTWLDNLGMDVPETLADAEKALYAFVNKDPDGNGVKDTYGISDSGLEVFWGAYGCIPFQWKEVNGSLVYGAVQPEMKEALAKMAQWYEDGIIDPEFVMTNENFDKAENKTGYWALSHDFINQKIGMSSRAYYYHWLPLMEQSGFTGHNIKEIQNSGNPFETVFGAPVIGPGGMGGTVKEAVAKPRGVIAKRMEEDAEKMARILEIINVEAESFDSYLTIRHGQDGVHHTYENGVLTEAEGYIKGDMAKIGGHVVFCNGTPDPAFGWEVRPGWKEFLDANIDQTRYYEDPMKGILPSASKYKSELDKLVMESYLDIITGKEDIDSFDAFVGVWKENGGDILTDEANQWYAKNK